jgi:hypothetical protein
MNAPTTFRPLAERQPDGRIAVYVGAGYNFLPREKALVLFQQLATALRIPYSEGVARYAARMLAAAHTDIDLDELEAEELALECGLLEPYDAPAGGCGESCRCDAGDKCLRLSPLARELVQLIDADPEPVREVGR